MWNNTSLTFGQFYHMHFYFWLKWQTLVWQGNLPSHRFCLKVWPYAITYSPLIAVFVFACFLIIQTNNICVLLTIESYKQTELISKFSLFYIIPNVFIVHPNSGKYIEEDEN